MGHLRTIPLLPALILAAGALAVSGCGNGEKLLPPGQAGSLDAALQQVSEATSGGDCSRALSELKGAQAIYAALPDTIDDGLSASIRQGLEQLARTVPEQCKAAAQKPARPPATTTGTTDTATTTTTPTTTTTTTTTPTTTTTTPTTTTQTTPPTTGTDPNGGITPDQTTQQPGTTP